MLQSYPVRLTKDENGTVIAQFPDLPEATTVGADETNALDWAQDALVVALTGYIEDRRNIPPPSKLKKRPQSRTSSASGCHETCYLSRYARSRHNPSSFG